MKHIHILGICGTFMGGLAVIARAAGYRVTGCDAHVYPPMSTQLETQGIELIDGYGVDQLALKPDLFVIGNVVARGNPLMEAILNQGLPYISGAQWLGENVLAHKWVLAVAGTHGKTTTTAMLTWILEAAGMAPGFLIGGVPNNFEASANLGASDFFVIEADEYDTAFFDKRSKFVHYHPRTLILNNLEYDHADIFPDLTAIETQFHHLLRTVPSQGRVIVNEAEVSLERVLKRGCWSEVEKFSMQDSLSPNQQESDFQKDWQIANSQSDDSFDVVYRGQIQGRVQATMRGKHNQMNMLAAIAAARHIGITPAVSIAALSEFKGVKRRMELRGEINDVRLYDDFAHHPTAIAATLSGLRKQVKSARILAVLEPRSNTMKLGVMKAQLPLSLAQADQVFAYGAQQGKDELGWDLAQTLEPLGDRAHTFNEIDCLVKAVVAEAMTGDHILVMSNGGFAGVHQKILNALQQKNKVS